MSEKNLIEAIPHNLKLLNVKNSKTWAIKNSVSP